MVSSKKDDVVIIKNEVKHWVERALCPHCKDGELKWEPKVLREIPNHPNRCQKCGEVFQLSHCYPMEVYQEEGQEPVFYGNSVLEREYTYH